MHIVYAVPLEKRAAIQGLLDLLLALRPLLVHCFAVHLSQIQPGDGVSISTCRLVAWQWPSLLSQGARSGFDQAAVEGEVIATRCPCTVALISCMVCLLLAFQWGEQQQSGSDLANHRHY